MNAHSLIILSNGGDITSESKHFFFISLLFSLIVYQRFLAQIFRYSREMFLKWQSV